MVCRGTWCVQEPQGPNSAIRRSRRTVPFFFLFFFSFFILYFEWPSGSSSWGVQHHMEKRESPSPLARGHHRKGPRVFIFLQKEEEENWSTGARGNNRQKSQSTSYVCGGRCVCFYAAALFQNINNKTTRWQSISCQSSSTIDPASWSSRVNCHRNGTPLAADLCARELTRAPCGSVCACVWAWLNYSKT